ncbi:MAG: AarF/UbiB family protein [Hyphomicrobiales bacterium]
MSKRSQLSSRERESNRFSGRMRRYARVGVGVGGVAARLVSGRMTGSGGRREDNARILRTALGNLKGPLMKVAQLLSTIPDALAPEYASELMQLQAQAPPMGWPFIRRRMAAELGPDWQANFACFSREAVAAASLGQVHRAQALDGTQLACKLQYPDMASAVEADLRQLQWIFAIHRQLDSAIDTREIYREIGDRLREELDYTREARHIALYGEIFKNTATIRVPRVYPRLSGRRLLTMGWLEGRPLLECNGASLEARNLIATQLFNAWWLPFCRHGVIHGDPHLGNYSVALDDGAHPVGINLLDYGCIRIFPPRFVAGVVELYEGLRHDDRDRIVHAYRIWGFTGLNNQLIDVLNIWARFIYGPLLEDRVRPIAEDVNPGQYGREQAFTVHRALKEKGPVRIPREFVFMDRAAVGLGSVFIRLQAEVNFYRLFNKAIESFSTDRVTRTQMRSLAKAGL